ncbi:SusC/RagA family TonB-linked outer membrane protein [Pedobacter alluvionis]|uniref:TonB-dependent receptor n=1 Tax=Pedobacter alluvionis TaxID=475253 RepID=A0A497Y9I3_9SPHI|nr:TonB-dependent receptor [Pedobacter alluvionis]RLJ76959.1 TonB-linked SusC/RagA family outer membrane protein [Pedobacter alluvionis]TFB33788.1 TonB-dependent receptor [Pedobacter alluvionis]
MKKLLLSMLLSLSVISFAFAQGKVITGKVTSASGPIPGVSVFVKGSPANGTQSDASGAFKITVAEDAKTLVFSFIGYKTKEVPITGQKINVNLDEENNTLSDVVVVGYGTQNKRDVTGSVASVKSKDLENLPVTSFEQALQGKAAGVQIAAQNGKLGQGITVRVRGAASVTAGSEPLYIVDGIPITSGDFSSTTASTSALADINTNDIESIEVLKDASASAIYGARASNGVVLITTKQGKAGKTLVQFNALGGVSSPSNHRDFLNAEQYVQLERRAGQGAANQDFLNGDYATLQEALDDYSESVEARLNRYSAGNNDYQTYKVNTNWEAASFQDKPVTQQYDLNLTGGNEKTKFYIGGQALDQQGIVIGNSYKRYSGRLNLTNKVTDFLEVGVNLNFSNSINNRLSNDNAFSSPLQSVALSPITPFIDPRSGLISGSLPGAASNYPVYYNPFISIDNAFYKATVYRTIGKAFANINLAKGLKFSTDFSIDNLNQNEESYYGSLTFRNTGTSNGYGQNISTFVINANTNNFLSYNTTIGKSAFDVILGTSYQKSTTKYSTIEGQDFPSDSYIKLGSAATKVIATSNEGAFSFLSYFFRANYKYNDRYLVGFSVRADGSSRFGANNRYGYFPAGSLAWIASEEDFLKQSETISLLKFRASYGLTGNAEIGNYSARGLFAGTGAYGGLPGQIPSQIANPDLTWEKTKQLDIGFDFGILKNRITGVFDFYQKNTTDLLLDVPIPQTTGFSVKTQNLGSLKNTGFELGINTENFVGAFKWSTAITGAINNNKITDLGGQILNSNEINAAIAGQPIGVFYIPEYAGVNPANGDAIYYKNTVVDGNVDRSTTNNINDAQRIFAGNPNPKYTFGLNNTFSYKNFDLGIFFQGVKGNKIFNAGGQYMSANGSNGYDNQTVDQMSYWNKPGDITSVPEPRLFAGNGIGNSTRYLSDGSYVRLKTLTLGYNFPTSILTKIKLSKLRLYATAQNLLTITGYKGWDPEVNADYQSTNINQGVDFYSAPQPRVISFGINIGL